MQVAVTSFGDEVAVFLGQQSGGKAGREVGESKDKLEPETINWNLWGQTGTHSCLLSPSGSRMRSAWQNQHDLSWSCIHIWLWTQRSWKRIWELLEELWPGVTHGGLAHQHQPAWPHRPWSATPTFSDKQWLPLHFHLPNLVYMCFVLSTNLDLHRERDYGDIVPV